MAIKLPADLLLTCEIAAVDTIAVRPCETMRFIGFKPTVDAPGDEVYITPADARELALQLNRMADIVEGRD